MTDPRSVASVAKRSYASSTSNVVRDHMLTESVAGVAGVATPTPENGFGRSMRGGYRWLHMATLVRQASPLAYIKQQQQQQLTYLEGGATAPLAGTPGYTGYTGYTFARSLTVQGFPRSAMCSQGRLHVATPLSPAPLAGSIGLSHSRTGRVRSSAEVRSRTPSPARRGIIRSRRVFGRLPLLAGAPS